MKMIKRLTDIALSTILFTAACVVGCTLEDPCEPNETLSETGKCIPIPTEPNDCGRSHYNCMTYGVKEARCDKKDNESPYYCMLVSCGSGFHRITNQDANTSAVMPEMCWQDSETECGESAEDCTKLEGALSVRCESGKCKVVSCRSDEYALMQDKCIKRNVRACGDDDGEKIDCISDWLPGIYHNNTSWINASVAGCADNACIVSSCQNLTVESNRSEIRFVKKSCNEVLNSDFAEAYTTSYRDLRGASIEMPECADDNAQPKNIDVCIEDLCPDDDSKFMPELCGCGVPEDTGDDDGDGVINCLDACPRNATKSTDAGAGDCGVKDTDRDGVDDSADVCPTRADISSAEQLDRNLLQSMWLLDNTGKPDIGRIMGLDDASWMKLCGILVEKERNNIDVFHIYNAKDLNVLRIKLREINSHESCNESLDSCNNNTRTRCIDGFKRTYHCAKCNTAEEDGSIQCKDEQDVDVAPDPLKPYLHIVLENDINLDDASNTLFYEDNSCITMWNPISYIVNIDFDGKGHTIGYTNLRSSEKYKRCSLSDALFDNIRFASVHDLKIDFNMQGSGHAVFANSVTRTQLSNLTIKSDLLESSVSDTNGVGLIAGFLESIENDTQVTIILENREPFRILAYDADNVGGLFGRVINRKTNSGYIPMSGIKILYNKRLIIDTVCGNNYVGGIIGDGYMQFNDPLDVEIHSIQGGYSVGGVIGEGDIIQKNSINVEIDEIYGGDYVGGVIGWGDLKQTIDADLSMSAALNVVIQSIQGMDNVGGIMGNGELSQDNSINVEIGSIEGSNNVGGVVGDCDKFEQTKTCALSASAIRVRGGDYVGGAFGNLALAPSNVSNTSGVNISGRFHTIYGNERVGGLIGNVERVLNSLTGHLVRVNLKNSVYRVYAEGNYVGGVFGYFTNNFENMTIDNYIGALHGDSNAGGVVGYVANQSSSREQNPVIKNRVGMIDATNSCVGGMIGNTENQSILLTNVYNEIGSMTVSGYAGGLIGCARKIDGVSNVYNHLSEVDSHDESSVGTLIGKLESFGNGKNQVSNVYNYANLKNVRSSALFVPSSKYKDQLCSDLTFSNISSYVNRPTCSDSSADLSWLDSCGVFDGLSVNNSVFGSFGTDDDNQCYNIITSENGAQGLQFKNTYWFSPDSEHYAPFGKDVSFDASKLTAFGDNANEISEVADSIKVWEPATEHIALGGKSYELPVVFTKEQFLQETGLTYDQSRYDDFDDWCRKIEQEHPELLDEIE